MFNRAYKNASWSKETFRDIRLNTDQYRNYFERRWLVALVGKDCRGQMRSDVNPGDLCACMAVQVPRHLEYYLLEY